MPHWPILHLHLVFFEAPPAKKQKKADAAVPVVDNNRGKKRADVDDKGGEVIPKDAEGRLKR